VEDFLRFVFVPSYSLGVSTGMLNKLKMTIMMMMIDDDDDD